MKKLLLIALILSGLSNAQTGGDFALSGGFWVAKTPVNQPEIIFANGFEN